jgi:hypothetical protein
MFNQVDPHMRTHIHTNTQHNTHQRQRAVVRRRPRHRCARINHGFGLGLRGDGGRHALTRIVSRVVVGESGRYIAHSRRGFVFAFGFFPGRRVTQQLILGAHNIY